MGSFRDICAENASADTKTAVHYQILAKNYDSFYEERHDAQFKVLLKYLDIKPDHTVLDIASGTGHFGERIFEKFQLKNPVWCVEPCAEMQEVVKKKKGVLAIQKTAEEFLNDLDKQQRFDRAMCLGAAHHFADPNKTYSDIESCLSPGGVFLILQIGKFISVPLFKKADGGVNTFIADRKENTSTRLRSANFEVEVSEELVDFRVTKTKWYAMLRERYHSSLRELSDEEVEEGINELEKGILHGLKPSDEVRICLSVFIFVAKKK